MEALGYDETFGAKRHATPTPSERSMSLAQVAAGQWVSSREKALSQRMPTKPREGRDLSPSHTRRDSFDRGERPVLEKELCSSTRRSSGLREMLLSKNTKDDIIANAASSQALIRRRLGTTPCMSGTLSSVALEDMVRRCEVWRYEAGEIILAEGCAGNFMLIIDEGEANIFKKPLKESTGGPDSVAQSPATPGMGGRMFDADSDFPPPNENGNFVRCVGAGDIIGEIALISSCPRTATVIAVTRVVCLCIPRHVFLPLCQDCGAFADTMMGLQTARQLSKRRGSSISSKSSSSAAPPPTWGISTAQVVALSAAGAVAALLLLLRFRMGRG
mmetsp:Transcript_32058/g.77543  ORF Transcript_32058/g.77543 Transcript_32058/m.77543 type:complete len:331 (-) Transcript_32058:19-1011(-)